MNEKSNDSHTASAFFRRFRKLQAVLTALCLYASFAGTCGRAAAEEISSVIMPAASVTAAADQTASQKKTAGDLETGSLISFGAYNGEPILWRVIGRDEEGNPLLYSEYILTYKAFDNAFWLANTDKNYGSNYWLNSDLRSWLNSAEETVTYDKDGAPTRGTVKYGYNSYEKEAGFLNGFSEKEQNVIITAHHKQLIDELNSTVDLVVNPDAKMHSYDSAVDACLTNYDEAKYLYTDEKVFLLDISEFYHLVYRAGYSVEKEPTKQAAKVAEQELTEFSSYWLRSPRASYAEDTAPERYKGMSAKPDGASVRIVYSDSLVLAKDAYDGTTGVVPALYLNGDTGIAGGNGTVKSPYTVRLSH